jgi:hopene-associated glycosyltransferase HpnB
MIFVVLLSFVIWVYLILAHGRFWSSTPELPPAAPGELPEVDIVIPARDEAETIGPVIASLLAQDYPGRLRIFLVDDNSTDGTAEKAGAAPNLTVLKGLPKAAGWSGKLWALSQGIAASSAPVLLFADADIVHDRRHLSALVARLLEPRADMVSEMVRLNCASLPERALVPAFVYFFQMLYPFARVNNPRSGVAAAAGGTVLIRREALERIGGIAAIRGALIDDVTLAKAVKSAGPAPTAATAPTSGAAPTSAPAPHHAIYLGHSGLATSIRPYPHWADLWHMITRTAFTQLRYSAVLLLLTLVGLTLVWLIPPWAILFGSGWERAAGLATFMLAGLSYLPTLARYRCSPLWALALPLIATFYMAATLGSALNYWLGRGARWKSRAYGA